MISGQAATPDTRNDCRVFADFVLTGTTPDGQAIGNGCVYPASIKTLPDQLNAVGKTWRAYAEGMGNDPTRESATCGHPDLNTVDHTQSSEAPTAAVPLGDQYATRHNPFVYFHSIIDSPDCASLVSSREPSPTRRSTTTHC
jgi:phosphatidylinositol-3-phosphatase